jgi:hypothetical protein
MPLCGMLHTNMLANRNRIGEDVVRMQKRPAIDGALKACAAGGILAVSWLDTTPKIQSGVT